MVDQPAVGAINPTGDPGSADPFAAWMAQYGRAGNMVGAGPVTPDYGFGQYGATGEEGS
jgi:hypothetical protein